MHVSRFIALAATAGLAASASAAVQAYDVSPADLAAGKPTFSAPHGTGSNPFAYDWDSAAPTGVDGPTSGAFYADVQDGGTTTADRYRTFRIGTRDLAGVPGGTLELSELQGITYQTNKPGAADTIDWRISIYTTPGDKTTDPLDFVVGAGDAAKWYRTRIQSFPHEASNISAPANAWNTWTTASGGVNELVWEGNNALVGNTYDWAALASAVGSEEIMMIDFTLGANSGGGTGASSLDSIYLDFGGGNGVAINVVPEPASLALLAMGGGVALLRRGRGSHKA